jgi:RNA polymerase sigma-70 factor (ECF subfamily)
MTSSRPALREIGAPDAAQPCHAPDAPQISCLAGGLTSSNGSDMALFKARRPSEGSAAAGGAAARGAALTDVELCRALAAGDAWAAEFVYDRVEDVVDAVLYRLMGPGDLERDDLAQMALERVITSVVQGRFSNGCSLRSWATLVTQHLAIDTMRARTRERKLFDRNTGHQALELVAEEGRTPERLAETRRRVERLLGALAAVNRTRAEAVVLHDIMGHDLAEIATLTGVTVAAAQSRLVRGRKDVLEFIARKEKGKTNGHA